MNKLNTALSRAIMLCVAAALNFCAIDAFAGDKSTAPTGADLPLQKIVRFEDLDLAKIEGAKSLYARLHAAAIQVCVPLESIENSMRRKHQACVNKAIGEAIASIDRPLLSQYHQSRIKGLTASAVQLAKAN